MTPEELLVHSDFMKRLVRSLVGNKDQAEDVLQQTWLTALERQNTGGVPTQTFLSRISRNVVRAMYRGEKSRRARERKYVDHKKLLEPEEIASLEEARRRLIESVLKLKEPYRNVILRRFYDDMSPKEIADRFGLSVNTVRTQIKRGVKMMRDMMDASQELSKQDWRIALAPIIGLYLRPETGEVLSIASSSTSSASQTVGQGAFLTAAKIKLLFIAATICTVAAFVPLMTDSLDPMDSLIEGDREVIPVQPIDPPGLNNPPSHRNSAEVAIEKVEASEIQFSISAINKETLNPVEGYRINLFMERSDGKSVLLWDETVIKDKDIESYISDFHTFSLPISEIYSKVSIDHVEASSLDLSGILFRVAFTSSRYLDYTTKKIPLQVNRGINVIEAPMDPGLSFQGQIVDKRTGKPIPGALIGAGYFQWEYFNQLKPDKLRESPEACVHAYSDENGYFFIQGIERNNRFLTIDHPDYIQAKFKLPSEDERQESKIEIESGPRIRGTVEDDYGIPTDDVRILLAGATIPVPRFVSVDPNGTFTTPPVSRGIYFLCAVPIDENSPFTQESRKVVVKDRDVEINLGPDPDRLVNLHGIIFDEQRDPIPDAKLLLMRTSINEGVNIDYRDQSFICDEHGRYSVPKLEPGTYCIKITHPTLGVSKDVIELTFNHPGEDIRDLTFKPNDITLSVSLVDSDTGRPFALGNTTYYKPLLQIFSASGKPMSTYLSSDKNGKFVFFEPLSPGQYFLNLSPFGVPGSSKNYPFAIQDGEKSKKLTIKTPAPGIVRVEVNGPKGIEQQQMFFLIDSKGNHIIAYSLRYESGSDKRTGLFHFPSGYAKAIIYCNKVGMVEHDFYIPPLEVTDLVIHSSEFAHCDHTVHVHGRLTTKNGLPLDDIRILARDALRPDAELKLLGMTTQRGDFYLSEFKPGYWHIRIEKQKGYTTLVDSITISKEQHNPINIDWTLDNNRLSGTLPKAILEAVQPHQKISVYLRSFPAGKYRCSFEGYPQESHFEFIGIPDGMYQFTIQAPGFEEYKSSPIYMENGHDYILEEIDIKPLTWGERRY